MKRRIAIVGINYRPELTGIAVYSAGLAEHLVRAGYEVDVYTGFPYYPDWRKHPGDEGRWHARETLDGVRVRRHWLYVPVAAGAGSRMLHELSFIATATLGYLFGRRADLTLVVLPPLPLGLPVALVARLKAGRVLVHVQDLQPDAAVEFGLLRPGRFVRLLYALERLTYRAAHGVSTISGAMLERIAAKGVPRPKLHLLRNWADDDLVRPQSRANALSAEWRLDGRFVVLYAGNLGRKQGLEVLLEAAALLADIPELLVVLVGNGAERIRLEAYASALGLGNVEFRPLVPRERLPELLASADVSVITQMKGSADAVLPSKLANILASRRPLVAAAHPGGELARTLAEGDCGLRVPPGDAPALAAAIRRLCGDAGLRERLAAGGRRWMDRCLSRRAVLPEVEALICALVAQGDRR